MFKAIKKRIITKALINRKISNPFDLEYADNFILSADAPVDFTDSHYFLGCNFSTSECLYFKLAKKGGTESDEVWLTYRDKLGDIYVAEYNLIKKGEKLPSRVECVSAGSNLRFFYDGYVMKTVKKENGYIVDENYEPVRFILEGNFAAKDEPFEFSFHQAAETLASSYARGTVKNAEELIQNLPTHYEQSGTMSANIEIGGKTANISNFASIRDRFIGKMNFSNIDKYFYSAAIFGNGDFYNASVKRNVELGEQYLGFYKTENRSRSVLKVNSSELFSAQTTPSHFSFCVEYVDGDEREFSVQNDFVVPYQLQNGLIIYEGFSSFNINGVSGLGITEFGFNDGKKHNI